MRGQILGVDARNGQGVVAGDDGQRYKFDRQDWSHHDNPVIGTQVDFEAEGNVARSVFPMASPVVLQMTPTTPLNDRNKIVAAVLAFFIGTLGIDRFYLGRTASGVIRIVLTITFIGIFVSATWSFIDAIRYLIMSDAEFAQRYQRI